MEILKFNDFMRKNSLKNDTLNESEIQRAYNYITNPRESKIHQDKGFVNIDNGSMGGTHWVCFY